MFVNGAKVGSYDTRHYHLTGDVGFFVETFDETRLHAHFDSIPVASLA